MRLVLQLAVLPHGATSPQACPASITGLSVAYYPATCVVLPEADSGEIPQALPVVLCFYLLIFTYLKSFTSPVQEVHTRHSDPNRSVMEGHCLLCIYEVQLNPNMSLV